MQLQRIKIFLYFEKNNEMIILTKSAGKIVSSGMVQEDSIGEYM